MMTVTMTGATLLIRSEMRSEITFRKAGCFERDCKIEVHEQRDEHGTSSLLVTHGEIQREIPNDRYCGKEFIEWVSDLHDFTDAAV